MRQTEVFRVLAIMMLLAVWNDISTAQSADDTQQQETPAKQQDAKPADEPPDDPATKPQSEEKPAAKQPVKKSPKTKQPESAKAKPVPPAKAKPAKLVQLPPPLPIDLALFRPDSLAGWTHAAMPPAGWSMHDGRLAGQADATTLMSGYAFGDFELHFRWTAAESATISVQLPQVPSGPTLSIGLGQSSNCGQIHENGKERAPGKKVPSSDQPHTAAIKRRGAQLSVTVDDQEVSSTKIAADCRFGLGLGSVGGEVIVEDMHLREPFGKSIFNGTDLTGWWCPGKIEAWQPIGGELVLAARGGNYLRTEKLYGNYTLSFEYKMKKGGNSGLGIRTPRDGWPSGDGMELQILDHPRVDKGGMMSIYRNVPPLAVAHKSEDWNQLVVKAEGRMISVWINGQLVQQCNTVWEPELKHRHLAGWIGFQDHGAKIQIRHLRLAEAPDGLGLEAWYAPRPEGVALFVLGRLLNTERLSRDDGSRGAALITRVEEKGEHILAEVNGPGALVRIASDDWSGELALYFDGEEKPRVACKAGELDRQVPRVPGAQDHSPLLTCLPFNNSLKVVLTDGGPATYRFEYVRLPKAVRTETFSKAGAIVPKSLAAVLDYRFHKHSHGVVRQHDPYLKIASERKKLAPGEQSELVVAEGAGLVQWVQVHCARRQLKTDDLWIDVTIDGEGEPAVSAPVRYFFSSAAAVGRHGNYLLTERGGAINRLAMPFGKGIRMSLSNRGSEAVDGAGLTASIRQAADEREAADFASRLRLRGRFRSGTPEAFDRALFEQNGRGRWAGLVCDSNEGEEPMFDSLRIDGQSVDGWQPRSVDDLLGSPGQTEDYRGPLSGRQGTFAWRYLLLAPIDFEREIAATVPECTSPGARLALFYLAEP